MCPYEPLEGGVLTGRYAREDRPEGWHAALDDRFTCVPAVIAGPPAQLREDLAATELSPTRDQRARITVAYRWNRSNASSKPGFSISEQPFYSPLSRTTVSSVGAAQIPLTAVWL
ncbi:hypothetical protein [Natronorarus salvus]|uniref:hypothetical protein n=1 Tax=Natronorarus salvus TaxID=3117733 RepID=UPI002F268F76